MQDVISVTYKPYHTIYTTESQFLVYFWFSLVFKCTLLEAGICREDPFLHIKKNPLNPQKTILGHEIAKNWVFLG